MWLSDYDKIPGLDGFPLGFLKMYWDFVKDDVVNIIQELHEQCRLPKAITTSFITLSLKEDNTQRIKEFRPTCLVECLYRIISKILEGRLKVVIGKLVSSSQSTLIEGRKMLEGMLVLNEVINYAKRNKKECVVVKVDFEKAYDCVSWGFLRYQLRRICFGHTTINNQSHLGREEDITLVTQPR